MNAAAGDDPSAAAGPPARAAVTGRRVLMIAGPVALSNATVPLQGAVDTALIGNLGVVASLAAVGLAAEIFGLMLGSLNFLQIGVSGLSAQALGADLRERVAHTLLRGLLLGAAFGALIVALRTPLLALGLGLFEASAEVERLAGDYFAIRVWGAPAELMNYALVGWFAGQELSRRLLQHQLVLTLSNVALNIAFVRGFGWGVEGVAAGTLIASYLGLAYGLWLARGRTRGLLGAGWRPVRARLFDRAELGRMMALNRDVFIRTVLLIGAFAWMARLGSMQGDLILAVNTVLMQFFLVSAYGLDGFAIAAETLVGQSAGARDRRLMDRAAWLSSVWAAVLALAVSGLFVLLSGAIIDLFSTAESVRETARVYALWAALIPIAGVAAFQLDGIFIGATASPEMRNGMILSSAVYAPLSLWMLEHYGNHGLWAALHIWLVLRALALLAQYPRIRARIGPAEPARAPA